jgi:UDP-glucuronate decarboxylase
VSLPLSASSPLVAEGRNRLAVVTGGAGFLGSHLCDRLIADHWRVIALDNLSTGYRDNLQQLMGHPRFEFIRHDVTKPLPPAIAEAQWLFNLACPASPHTYQRIPVETTLTSVIGVWQLLALAEQSGARVLQASSSEVYGDPHEHPQMESYRGNVNPIGPRACYDEGKRCAETLCFAYHLERDVPIRVARIFNTYGPRISAADGRVVSNFVMQALREEPLTIYGDGQQTRSFCYVDDTIEALCRLMNAEVEGPLNIGNPIEHTVLELAETVLRLTGSRSRLEHRHLPPDDPHRRCPDISRTHRHLDWQPRIGLEDGLRQTIAYMRQQLVTT